MQNFLVKGCSMKRARTESDLSSESDDESMSIRYARLNDIVAETMNNVPEFDVKLLQSYHDMKQRVYRNSHVGLWLKELEKNDLAPVDLYWDLCGDAGTALENCILEVVKKMKYDGIRFDKAMKEKNRSSQTATYDVSIFFDDPTNLASFQKSCKIEGNYEAQKTINFSSNNAGFTKGEIKSSKLKDKGTGRTCLDLKHIHLDRFSFLIAAFRMKGKIRVFIMNKNIFEQQPGLLTSNGVDGGLRLVLISPFSLDQREKAEEDILRQLTMLSFPWFNIHF